MRFSPEALLDLADLFEITLDFDKEGICFHIQDGRLPGLEEAIDLISAHQDEIKPVWLERFLRKKWPRLNQRKMSP